MKRRLDVGLGIVHRPAVLFLDEPTTGLDPQARARMWDEIRALRDAGHDRLPDDALPRGGRRAGRPAGDHRPRPDRRRGHRRRAQAPGRRRRRDARRQRPTEQRRSRPSGISRSSARRPARTASSGSTSTVARRPSRCSSASSTEPGSRPPSIALARPSLDDVFLRQTGRSSRRAAHERGRLTRPRHIERSHRHEDHPRHLAHLPSVPRADHPAAHLDRLRDDAAASSTSSCSGRSSRAPSSRPGPARTRSTGSCRA